MTAKQNEMATNVIGDAESKNCNSERGNEDSNSKSNEDYIEISVSTSAIMDSSTTDDPTKHFTHMLGGFYPEDSSKIFNFAEVTDDTASDTTPLEIEEQRKSTLSSCVMLAACDIMDRLAAKKKQREDDDDDRSCAMSSITTYTARPPRRYVASSAVFADAKQSDGVSGGSRNTEEQPSCFKTMGLARQEWPMLSLAFVLMVLGESWSLFIPLLLRDAYDYLVDPNRSIKEQMSEINRIMSIVIVIHSFGIMASFARTSTMSIAGERVAARLRNRLYEALLHQNIPFFDKHDTSELVSRLRTDPALLQQATSIVLPEIALGSLKLCVSLGIMASISIKFTLLTIALFAIIICCCFPLGKMIAEMKQEYEHVLDQAQAQSAKALEGIRTVQAFNTEGKESERYKNLVGDPDSFQWCWPTDHWTRRTTYSLGVFKSFAVSGYNNMIFGAGFGATYISVWYGFKLVSAGDITIGGLVCFQLYALLIGAGLGHSSRFVAQYIDAEGAAGRIFHLLDRLPARYSNRTSGNDHTCKRMQLQQKDSTVRDDSDEETFTSMIQRPASLNGAIGFNNVHFFHPFQPGVLALYNFSLSISPNTTVALVGDSVAGSSVMSLLQRFYDLSYRTGGSITVDGLDVRDLDIHWLRTQIGYVPHNAHFFGTSTIRENITYGNPSHLEVSQEELESVCRLANAHDFISSWPRQYDTMVGSSDDCVELSSDQKQRIAIARAILTNPRILLLEEAVVPSASSTEETESADHLVQQAIENAITGRTALIVAHRLSTLQRADQIVVMNHHQIVDIADHDTLLQRCSKYQDIVRRKCSATDELTPEKLALTLDSTTRNENRCSRAQPVSAATLFTGSNTHAESIAEEEFSTEEEESSFCYGNV
jgi:ABC-type multidrug transport system fused ATPase/permease subunit